VPARSRSCAVILGILTSLMVASVINAASISVSPTSVPVGGTVTLSGDVLDSTGQPGCQVPGTVTLLSGAFAGQGSFMNQDVETSVGSDGNFSVQATILPGVAPGSYTVTGRCGGGNLGVQATLVVTARLPSTGSGGAITGSASDGFSGLGTSMLLVVLAGSLVLVAGWLVRRSA
jgi:hypothetical protein